MFGKLGELSNLMKNLPQIQSRIKEMQAKVETMTFTADSGAGAVTATVSGKLILVSVRISQETVVAGDVEMLEDLVKSAVAAAQRKATDSLKEQMREMSGGMNIPGLENMLG